MKKIFFLPLLLLVFNFGCKKNDSNPVVTDPPKSLVVNSISGQLTNWTFYRYYQAEFGSFGSSLIDENGKFEITSLTEPAGSQLGNVISIFDSTKALPTISDQTAKYYLVSALTLAKAKSPYKNVGYIQSSSARSSSSYFSTSYIYFNKAVTINGYATYTFNYGPRTFTRKDHYNNVSFEKGWNKYVSNQGAFDEATMTSNVEILREEPAGALWNYSNPLNVASITGSVAYAGLKFPLCIDNGYKRCAALYTAAEVQYTGDITKLSWKALTGTASYRPIKIYLKEVPDTVLSADALSKFEDGATLVYDGSVQLLTNNWNWNDFVLSDVFHFSGSKNLLVIVETNYEGTGTADDCYFEYSVLPEKKFLTWSWNNTAIQATGTPSTSRPNIQITLDGE